MFLAVRADCTRQPVTVLSSKFGMLVGGGNKSYSAYNTIDSLANYTEGGQQANLKSRTYYVMCSNSRNPLSPKLNFAFASLMISTISDLTPKFPSSDQPGSANTIHANCQILLKISVGNSPSRAQRKTAGQVYK